MSPGQQGSPFAGIRSLCGGRISKVGGEGKVHAIDIEDTASRFTQRIRKSIDGGPAQVVKINCPNEHPDKKLLSVFALRYVD